MWAVLYAGMLGGITMTVIGYQVYLTGALAWLWLLGLNAIWFVLFMWGATTIDFDKSECGK